MAALPLTPPSAAIPRLVHRRPLFSTSRLPFRRISAASRPLPSPPPPPPPGQAYQPFRPPPSPLPAKYRSLGPLERLAILRDRLGLWHEYAPLISSLAADGFTPPSIEEATGISGVEQNRLAVATQVRDSLLSSPSLDPAVLSHFDSAGAAELLYELRLLSAPQRAAAACRVAALRLDPKAAQELARAIKDFPRRRGSDGWDRFSAASPGDCLAYSDFRLSREALSAADRVAALERAMAAAETEGAKETIAREMERAAGGGGCGGGEEEADRTRVTVVRLRYGEVAEASSVAVLPACMAEEGAAGLAAAPGWCRAEGGLGVVAAERAWGRWAVLPGWGPVAGLGARGGVAVEFVDARVLPWGRDRWEKKEAVLVVADRGRTAVETAEGLYVVAKEGGLGVERGAKLSENGVGEALATVVMVVKPPREDDDDQLSNEDWE